MKNLILLFLASCTMEISSPEEEVIEEIRTDNLSYSNVSETTCKPAGYYLFQGRYVYWTGTCMMKESSSPVSDVLDKNKGVVKDRVWQPPPAPTDGPYAHTQMRK